MLQHLLFISHKEKSMSCEVRELPDIATLFAVVKTKTDRRVAKGFQDTEWKDNIMTCNSILINVKQCV